MMPTVYKGHCEHCVQGWVLQVTPGKDLTSQGVCNLDPRSCTQITNTDQIVVRVTMEGKNDLETQTGKGV